MSRSRAGLVLVALAALAAVPLAVAGDKVAFGSQVVPILDRHCVSCHVEGGELGGLSLYPDPWARLVGVTSNQSALKLVEPGSPEKSYLYLKLLSTQESAGGSGLRMPPQQPLPAADLETIRRWIQQGAGPD